MAAGTVTEAIVEEVAENLEEVAEITRRINPSAVSYFIGGTAFGVGLGFYFGFRFSKEKLRAEAFAKSQEEVAEIKAMYEARMKVAKAKPTVEQIIEDRGYSVATPPEPERPLKPPVPVVEAGPLTFDHPEPPVESGWDYATELARRTGEKPYVIHKDEFESNEHDFSQVTYTYYTEDDVLTGEDDRPLAHADLIVGQDNLQFGHGSEDPNVVYVRNVSMTLEMEITRHPGSYEQVVLGLDPIQHSDRGSRKQRQRYDGT